MEGADKVLSQVAQMRFAGPFFAAHFARQLSWQLSSAPSQESPKPPLRKFKVVISPRDAESVEKMVFLNTADARSKPAPNDTKPAENSAGGRAA